MVFYSQETGWDHQGRQYIWKGEKEEGAMGLVHYTPGMWAETSKGSWGKRTSRLGGKQRDYDTLEVTWKQVYQGDQMNGPGGQVRWGLRIDLWAYLCGCHYYSSKEKKWGQILHWGVF